MSELSFDAAADALYAAEPAGFVALRDRLTKQARAEKNRDLANAIKGLRRPTVAAWLVNMAVRHCGQTMADLLDVGDRLRAAQAALDGAAMKALSAQRGEIEHALLDELAGWLRERGETSTAATMSEVQDTLRAAVADSSAGRAVQSGRLTRALSYAGFGDVDLAGAVAGGEDLSALPVTTSASVDPGADPGVNANADADLGVATDAAAEADADPDDLDALTERAQAALEAAQRQVAQLSAKRDVRAAQRALEAARARRREAELAVAAQAARVVELAEELKHATSQREAAEREAAQAREEERHHLAQLERARSLGT